MSIKNNIQITDTWTHNLDYANRYQTPAQISDVIDSLKLSEARTFLDIGCGNGAFSMAAAVKFPSCQIFAVDPLDSAVEECQKRFSQAALTNLSVKQALSENLPFQDNSIERVLMRNLIHHLRDVTLALKEASRILAPGGLLIIEAPCNVGDLMLGLLINDIYWLMDDSHRRTYYHPEQITSILRQYGVNTRSTTLWKCSSKMSSQAVSLIKKQQMESQLQLQLNKDGQWLIKLNFMRIILQK